MNGWMIAADGSAVNLARVDRVVVGLSAASDSESGKRWYVAAEFVSDNRWMSGAILASKIASREAAVNWIRERFGPDAVD